MKPSRDIALFTTTFPMLISLTLSLPKPRPLWGIRLSCRVGPSPRLCALHREGPFPELRPDPVVEHDHQPYAFAEMEAV